MNNSVQFARNIEEVFEIPCLEDFTPKEIAAQWLQKLDYERMDDDNIALLERMSDISDMRADTSICNHITSDSSFTISNACTRGLEQFVPERRSRRDKTKKDAWNAVIDEQQSQWSKGIEDPIEIAKVYRQLCIYPLEIAQYRGLMDEKEAQEIQSYSDVDNDSSIATGSSMNSYALYNFQKNKRLAKARPTLTNRDAYFSVSSTRLLKSNVEKNRDVVPVVEESDDDVSVSDSEVEDLSSPVPSKHRSSESSKSSRKGGKSSARSLDDFLKREDDGEEEITDLRGELRKVIHENVSLPPKDMRKSKNVREAMAISPPSSDKHIDVDEEQSGQPSSKHSKKREEITATPPSSDRLVTRHQQHTLASPKKTNPPSKRTRVRTRRCVHFADFMDVHKSNGRHFTSGDCWYSKNEIHKMKVQCRQLTREIASGGRRRQKIDTRGLEHMIGVQDRKKTLSYTINTVLDEQDRQYYEYNGKVKGVMEPVKLAKIYRACSLPCVQAARKRAFKDEQDVLDLWRVADSMSSANSVHKNHTRVPLKNTGADQRSSAARPRSRSHSPSPRNRPGTARRRPSSHSAKAPPRLNSQTRKSPSHTNRRDRVERRRNSGQYRTDGTGMSAAPISAY